MNYKVIVFNNAEEIEKALNEAYKAGYEAGYDDCFNEADDFFSTEDVEAKEELRKKHEAELDKVGHEAYEEGKRVGNEEGYQKGYEEGLEKGRSDISLTGTASTYSTRQIGGITWTDNGGV